MTLPISMGDFSGSPEGRPALLEGRWLGHSEGCAISAASPADVLEGDSRKFAQFSDWLVRNAARYPAGGAIGYIAYEMAGEFERVPVNPGIQIPVFSFAYYPRIEKRACGEVVLPCSTELKQVHILQDFDPERWISDVQRIRDYIAAGDIYQANLTHRFAALIKGVPPENLYARLAATRAPMSAFLKTPHAAIISHSPERFFRVKGNRILASPVKGTVARSGDPADDSELQAQLLASAKDRAENVMIVDLLRNDLGRICHYESIQARLWEIDELPHLYHLVSHVEGELRPESGPAQILRALFPCGSITGAPKIRAMEILGEIENTPRGVSMGAIGIITGKPDSPQFKMDFNVAIRTITVRDDIAEFNVGGGIVYDSQPEAEFAEMILKAKPLLEALGLTAPEATSNARWETHVAPTFRSAR